jgi:hypothetical protein
MICGFVYRQISYYSSRIISDSWTSQSEKFCLITAILTSTELITTAKEECSRISWKQSVSKLNTRTNESRIKLSESSTTIAICSRTFNSESMSCTTSVSLKYQKSSSSSKHRRRSSHTRTLKRHILKMSEKTSDINQSINQSIRLRQPQSSINQLISRHQLFRSHSGKHLFNHHTLNHYTLNYHTIYHTLQSISHTTSTIGRRTHQSISTHPPNHPGHHTSATKFGLSRKHLNRIYLNQFNHLHLHLNHLYSHFRPHPHLQPLLNRFTSVNHSMNRVNYLMTRMIDSDNWRYWIKSTRRIKISVTRAAILTSKYWNFMTNVDVRDYSSTRICRVSRSFLRARHLITIIQICNFVVIHFMNFAST